MSASEVSAPRVAFGRQQRKEIEVQPFSAVTLTALGVSMEPAIRSGPHFLIDTLIAKIKTTSSSSYLPNSMPTPRGPAVSCTPSASSWVIAAATLPAWLTSRSDRPLLQAFSTLLIFAVGGAFGHRLIACLIPDTP